MDYNKQAEEFLGKTKTTLTITKAEQQKSPLWAKEGERHGINYTCTLENKNHKYTFDFWDSIGNRELIEAIQSYKVGSFFQDSEHFRAVDLLQKNGIKAHTLRTKEAKEAEMARLKPSPYDILTCLSPLYEDTLEEFCDAMGYDQDSKTAEKVYRACIEQDRNLRKLFSHAEMELLAEIQ